MWRNGVEPCRSGRAAQDKRRVRAAEAERIREHDVDLPLPGFVRHEVDGGLETVQVKTPFVITTDLRLNEPRYASLPNIMKAKKKPIAEKNAADTGVDLTPHLEILKTSEPPGRKGGVKVKDVTELVTKLKTEAGVL